MIGGSPVPLGAGDFAYAARVVHADKVGVIDEPGFPGGLGMLTYAEVMARCDGMVAALERLEIGVGERVAIVSPNAAKLLIALYAVTGSGRVLVPVNFRLGADEVDFIVADSGASLLLVDPELDQRLAAVGAPRRVVMDGEADAELFAPAEREVEWAALAEDAPATINYTSGTTAAPKGVVLSQRSLWLNAITTAWSFGITPADRYLHTLPIFHVNGWGLPMANAAAGAPNVIQREVRGPEILRRVEEHGITLLCGATPVAAAIEAAAAAKREVGARVPGEGTTRLVSGGAPTPPAVIERFERNTGWELIHAYGLTETGPVLTVNRVLPSEGLSPSERAERLAAAGRPIPGVRLRVDPEGQIEARTAKALSGYWKRDGSGPDGEGWLATGDGGTFEDGTLRITDRKKDVIISGGENISSLEVEAVLHDHPDIAEAAVIGIPHERWGETPLALLVMREGATLDPSALAVFCRERLAGFKCPTVFEARDELPRTATGKVQKFVLRGPYWREARD